MKKPLLVIFILVLLLSMSSYAEEKDYVVGYGCMEVGQCMPVEFKNIILEGYARYWQRDTAQTFSFAAGC